MKNKLIFIIAFTMLSSGHVLAQPDLSAKNRAEITKYLFFVGEWEGEGTSYTPSGMSRFTVKESIFLDIDSTVLHIKGTGWDVNTGTKGHDALAIMYWDHMTSSVKMHSFVKTGSNVMADVKLVGDNSFEWGFATPNGGKMTFLAEFTENTWTEKGTYTTPEGASYPTITMNLKRKP